MYLIGKISYLLGSYYVLAQCWREKVQYLSTRSKHTHRRISHKYLFIQHLEVPSITQVTRNISLLLFVDQWG